MFWRFTRREVEFSKLSESEASVVTSRILFDISRWCSRPFRGFRCVHRKLWKCAKFSKPKSVQPSTPSQQATAQWVERHYSSAPSTSKQQEEQLGTLASVCPGAGDTVAGPHNKIDFGYAITGAFLLLNVEEGSTFSIGFGRGCKRALVLDYDMHAGIVSWTCRRKTKEFTRRKMVPIRNNTQFSLLVTNHEEGLLIIVNGVPMTLNRVDRFSNISSMWIGPNVSLIHMSSMRQHPQLHPGARFMEFLHIPGSTQELDFEQETPQQIKTLTNSGSIDQHPYIMWK